MPSSNQHEIISERILFRSALLEREVIIDFFCPSSIHKTHKADLLLINDGQNLEELGLVEILANLYNKQSISSVICVGIHSGERRLQEYGIARKPDYLGRGGLASGYADFVLQELLPFIRTKYSVVKIREAAFAGFSLGALMALDIVFNHPHIFTRAGMFSGSFWWRSLDHTDQGYDDRLHRIIHQEIRNGSHHPGLKFFFQCGGLDETGDRNKNGIIDSIDDTLDLINELVAKGYNRKKDILYYEMPEGRHDIGTWAQAMPVFLKWGWGKKRWLG